MNAKLELKKDIDAALDDLEKLADEVRVKLHLAEMDMSTKWNETLEPRLFAARTHAKEATVAAREAIKDTVAAVREFAHLLEA